MMSPHRFMVYLYLNGINAGGMKVKADRDESSPFTAILVAQDVAKRCKELGITALHIKLLATGGNKTKTRSPGTQSALRTLGRSGMQIDCIDNGITKLRIWILRWSLASFLYGGGGSVAIALVMFVFSVLFKSLVELIFIFELV